jgi:hypothetical protein
MLLRLERAEAGRIATLGNLYVDDEFCCHTLEDVVRPDGVKIAGETAIPYGSYPVVITWSPKFRRRLPLIADVPMFEGIRIHPGNTTDDTDGCILVGEELDGDRLLRSRAAFDRLFPMLDGAQARREQIRLEIVRLA